MKFPNLKTLAWLDRAQPQGTVLTLEWDGSVAIDQPHKVMNPVGSIIAQGPWNDPKIRVIEDPLFGTTYEYPKLKLQAHSEDALWLRMLQIFGVTASHEQSLLIPLRATPK